MKIYILRDGTFYFRSSPVQCKDLSDMIREAVRIGAEKRIYLEVDARARYSAVSAVLSQVALTGIENVSILADSPDGVARLWWHRPPAGLRM
ncbi:MAG: ExbD/TolR family protein [Candidatus Acidiferrales bacterium]